MAIGQRIKNTREKLGISQVDLATTCKITKQNLYKYENNIITNIPSDKIECLADALGVSPAYLMGWESDDESDSNSTEKHYTLTQNINVPIFLVSPAEQELIKKYRKLPRQIQLAAKQMIESAYEVEMATQSAQGRTSVNSDEDDKAYIQIAAYGGKGVELHPYDKKDQEEIDALFDEIDREERLNDYRNRNKK